MKKIKVKFPESYSDKNYFGLINGGTYTIDPFYRSKTAFLTVEKMNYGKGVFVSKDWCTVLPDIDLELPEDLFDL